GFYHANSIFKEYKDIIDILNITPGAVITENTQFLKNTPFKIDCEKFVNNILKMLGNVQGTTCAYWGHELSNYLVNFAPWMKDKVLHETGLKMANYYMSYRKNY